MNNKEYMNYFKEMNIYKKRAKKILKERGEQYGSYEFNIRTINAMKHYINIYVDQDINKIKTPLDIDDVNTAVEFTKYMLALKGARMKHPDISKESWDDCVIDIINYYNLLVEYLNSCEWVVKYEIKFVHNFPLTIDAIKEIQFKGEYLRWLNS